MSVTRAYLANTPFDQFDPNAGQAPEVAWGLYASSTFRTWAERGPAVAASHHVYGGFKLYKFVNGRWEYVTGRAPGPDPQVCSECGASTMQPRPYSSAPNMLVNTGKWGYKRASRSKLADPLELQFVCRDCR